MIRVAELAAPLFRSSLARQAPPAPSTRGAALIQRVRTAAARRMGIPDVGPPWRHGSVPTVHQRHIRRALTASLPSARVDFLLLPSAGPTSYERAVGRPWAPAGVPERASVVERLANALRNEIMPAAQTAATRRSYDGPWGAFLIFALANRRESDLLPTAPDLLDAFVSYLTAADLAGSTIRRYLSALQDQHQRRGFALPWALEQAAKVRRAIARHSSRARRQIAPVTPSHLRRLLALPEGTPSDLQDTLATVLCTVTGIRPSDLVNVDVCDLLLSFAGDPPGTAALRVWASKADIARKGHHPRIGRPRQPRNDLVRWLLYWCQTHHLLPSPRCSKGARPAAQCSACGTLFRTICQSCRPLPTADPAHPWRPIDFTRALRRAMERIGCNPAAFDGRSCGIGALSVGASNLIPGYLITLQTGHALPRDQELSSSAQRYAVLQGPRALFALWDAFGL
jgi:integrase